MANITLNKGLGWFSIGLGLAELIFPRKIAYAFGANAQPELVATTGGREIVTGIGILSDPRSAGGLWARVGGDVFDALFIGANAMRPSNTKKTGACIALGIVAGALLVDIYAAAKTSQG